MKYICLIIVLAVTLLIGCESGEAPETPSAETEPTSKSVGDVEAGKALASSQCASCHGMDGVSARSGAPFIAGVSQGYFINAMLGYSKGSRKNDSMQAIAETLSPKDLADISTYYAQLDTPWKGAIRDKKAGISLANRKSIDAGKVLASSCNSCHGPNGNAVKSDVIPRLAGMSVEYFIPALKSYFSGDRQHDVMRLFKQSTSKTDVKNLAAYYATRIPKQAPQSPKGNPGAGKTAAAACAGCHGYDGNSLNPYMPNLAGQSVEYLIKAIKDYREGSRKDELMQAPVRKLSDKTITNIAAYYARQAPRSPLMEEAATARAFSPVDDGRKIATSCNACHGNDGNSTTPGTPSLTGLNVKYLVGAVKAYQDGVRKHTLMQKLVSHLSDTDIEKVSFYYATREPAASGASHKGDVIAGMEVSAACAGCHGQGGVSTDPKTPSLAGQDSAYLAAATRGYATGERSNDTMKSPAEALDEKNIIDVAAYYATQRANKPETLLPEAPEFLIKERCNRCHGERGFSNMPGKPRLAGQVESYLVLAMQEYQDGRRKHPTMHAMADVLSLLEIKAVAAFYAKQE